MSYKNELPPMISNRDKDSEQAYKKCLLRILPAVDLNTGKLSSYKIDRMDRTSEGKYHLFYLKALDQPKVIREDIDIDGIKHIHTKSYEVKDERSSFTLDELLEKTISALNINDIPNSLKIEYTRNEKFKNFLQKEYPSLAERIEYIELKNNSKSDCYNFFYKYFLSGHNNESRISGVITDKQAVFMISDTYEMEYDSVSRSNGRKDIELHHPPMFKELGKMINTCDPRGGETYPIGPQLEFYGNPSWNREDEGSLRVSANGEVSYSQSIFIEDVLDAYKDVYNMSNEMEKKWLNRCYGNCIKELEEMIRGKNKSEFVPRIGHKEEKICGATHTKEEMVEILKSILTNPRSCLYHIYSKDYVESILEFTAMNLVISNIVGDPLYKNIADELFPNYAEFRKIFSYSSDEFRFKVEKEFDPKKIINNGKIDFISFFNQFMNEAYKDTKQKENSIKSRINDFNRKVTSIEMYKRSQNLKEQISKLEEKLQRIEAKKTTIQEENGELLPSIYKKQNIFQKMKKRINRFIYRKQVARVENELEALEISKRGIAREIDYYKRKYNNIHIQNEEIFNNMNEEELEKRKRECENQSKHLKYIDLSNIMKYLEMIEKTGALEINEEPAINN